MLLDWGRVRFGAADSAPPYRRRTFWRQDYRPSELLFLDLFFSAATLFRFVSRFARARIEDFSFRSTAFKELPASLFFLHYSKNNKKIRNGAEMSGAETARRRVKSVK